MQGHQQPPAACDALQNRQDEVQKTGCRQRRWRCFSREETGAAKQGQEQGQGQGQGQAEGDSDAAEGTPTRMHRLDTQAKATGWKIGNDANAMC